MARRSPVSMIAGTGMAVPSKVISNADLERMVDTSDEWIVSRTGIRYRTIVENGVVTSDLCTEAAQQALTAAGVAPEAVDMILVATVTPDVKFPATACFVQERIGAVNAVAFDLSAACSGWLYAITIGDRFLADGRYQNILCIGSDVLSSIVDWSDRNTCVLFGDGAGACVLQHSESERGILASFMRTDGRLTGLLTVPGGGTRIPVTDNGLNLKDHRIQMQGREVFKHAVRNMTAAAQHVLQEIGMTPDDITLLIPHQANVRIIESVAKQVGMPMERVFVNLDRYGNTSAASIPMAFHEARAQGRLEPGDVCLMVVFGGGFTWGAAVIRV